VRSWRCLHLSDTACTCRKPSPTHDQMSTVLHMITQCLPWRRNHPNSNTNRGWVQPTGLIFSKLKAMVLKHFSNSKPASKGPSRGHGRPRSATQVFKNNSNWMHCFNNNLSQSNVGANSQPRVANNAWGWAPKEIHNNNTQCRPVFSE
jgi:hypothetical protein